mgnify:CR=1 FL=1
MPAAAPRVSLSAKASAAPAAAKGGASVAQKALQKLGLQRDIDLALHLPLRYEDETRITPLANARDGQMVQIEATVTASEIQLRPRRQLLVQVEDETGSCELRFFSFYPSHQKTLAVGARLRIRGEIKGGFWGRQMMHPAFRVAGGELPAALTPVYPTTAGLPQPYLRRAVVGALTRVDLSDTLPPGAEPPVTRVYGQNGLQRLFSLREALTFLHHPTPDVALSTLEDHSHPAWQRLKAEELLAQQLSQQQSRRARDMLRAPVLRAQKAADGALPLHEQLLAVLPFSLTAAQRRVGEEIAADLARQVPMHRLLQGDVGSGKTVVSALAACLAMDAGWQCALMAPTEILAEQHFAKLVGWLEPLGITVAWLTGSQKTKERREMLAAIESGEAQLVVGTHAVIQDKVKFRNLVLAVIDEQHRFGVAQRMMLASKAERSPHLLVMTATPIPRTLTLTYYGEMDVSRLDEMPPGRQPIQTLVMSANRLDEVVEGLARHVEGGGQAYWVCPLVEESETSDQAAAEMRAETLRQRFGDRVGLVHGKMKGPDKDAAMEAFAANRTQILVATTVIEVGVDVPNSSLIVIEGAERFGLAQLHQLRGRVGRGDKPSVCLLLRGNALGETSRARLALMRETNDGFRIAEEDLKLRGAGEVLGTRQSGEAELKIATPEHVSALVDAARDDAHLLIDRDGGLDSERGQAARTCLYLFEKDAAVGLLRGG